MNRILAGGVVLVGLIGLAGCKPAVETTASAPAASATVAAPAPVAPVATVTAPAAAAVPDDPAKRIEWLTKGAQSISCSQQWLAKSQVNPNDSGKHFIEVGIAPEIHEVAQRIAAPQVKKLEGMRMPANEAERAQMEFAAISMAKDVPVTDPAQLPAIAWMAYFLDRAAKGNCPPPPELLGLIGKQQ